MDRARRIRRVGLVVLGANLVLAGAKAAVWYTTGSLAVGSEALNSTIDTLYSAVVLGGLYLSTRPPDHEHPHGHERIEPFVSFVIALAVFAAAGGVLWSAVEAVRTGAVGGRGSLMAAGVLAAGAAVKGGLARYCQRAGAGVDSPALVALARDNRADVLTALAALAGVLGARIGVPILDPIAAGVVAIGIAHTGVEILRDNLPYLVGAAPSDDLRSEIRRRALAHEAVDGVHDVIAHYVGPEVDVSLHVEVAGDRTLTEAHDIESAVADAIGTLDEVDDVYVHVDPKELGEWKAPPEDDPLT